MPVSVTVRAVPSEELSTVTVTRPFCLLYFTALSTRLKTISSTMLFTPLISALSPITVMTTPFFLAEAFRRPATSRAREERSKSSRSSWTSASSRRERFKMSSTKVTSRWDSS